MDKLSSADRFALAVGKCVLAVGFVAFVIYVLPTSAAWLINKL